MRPRARLAAGARASARRAESGMNNPFHRPLLRIALAGLLPRPSLCRCTRAHRGLRWRRASALLDHQR